MPLRIGIIADTHGRVHPRVEEVFAGAGHILHAGDVGGVHVIEALQAIAPVTFVRGNNDDASGEDIVRATIDGLCILLTHILPKPEKPARRVLESLREQPADIVIFGHSHMQFNARVGGVWYFNPASAGPRRFHLPVSVGLLEKHGREWRARHVSLTEPSR